MPTYARDEQERPFDLVNKFINDERRKQLSTKQARDIIQARLKKHMELRRTADHIILVSMNEKPEGNPRERGYKTALMRRKATIDRELEGL